MPRCVGGFEHRMNISRILAGLAAIVLQCVVPPAFGAVIVLPGAYSASEAPASIATPLTNSDSTFQWVFASSSLVGLNPGTAIVGIGFRLDGGSSDRPGVDLTYSTWDLQLSQSNNPAGSLSATFADNIAADVVTVRSGPLAIPAGSLPGGPGPNSFNFIAFTTPYVFSGGDLLLTLRQDNTGGAPLVAVDGVGLADLAGVADTVRATSATETTGTAQFFNVPVTALEIQTVPEPSAAWLVFGGFGTLLLLSRLRRR